MPELSPAAQHWEYIILVWVGLGSLAGLLARMILPVREPSGALATLTLGITGSCLGPGRPLLVGRQSTFQSLGS